MTLSLITILTVGSVSLYFTDIESKSVLLSVLLPIVDLISLIALAFWFVWLFHKRGVKQTFSSSSETGGVGMGGDFLGGDGDC